MAGIIKNYVAPVAVHDNPYTADVAKLIAAGEGAAYAVEGPIPTGAERERGTVESDKRLFQDAARAAGFSARETERYVNENGNAEIVFVLRPERKRKVKADKVDADK